MTYNNLTTTLKICCKSDPWNCCVKVQTTTTGRRHGECCRVGWTTATRRRFERVAVVQARSWWSNGQHTDAWDSVDVSRPTWDMSDVRPMSYGRRIVAAPVKHPAKSAYRTPNWRRPDLAFASWKPTWKSPTAVWQVRYRLTSACVIVYESKNPTQVFNFPQRLKFLKHKFRTQPLFVYMFKSTPGCKMSSDHH